MPLSGASRWGRGVGRGGLECLKRAAEGFVVWFCKENSWKIFELIKLCHELTVKETSFTDAPGWQEKNASPSFESS